MSTVFPPQDDNDFDQDDWEIHEDFEDFEDEDYEQLYHWEETK